jgi:hypothetical protein
MVIHFNFRRTLFVLIENYQIDLKEHIELIVLALVGITVLPVDFYKFSKNQRFKSDLTGTLNKIV